MRTFIMTVLALVGFESFLFWGFGSFTAGKWVMMVTLIVNVILCMTDTER